jgi:hypothetical protein
VTRLYATFDKDGNPAHIREAWQGVEGMEALPDGMTVEQAAQVRFVGGKWRDRLPVPVPTADELARASADDLAARQADRAAAMKTALEAETPLLVAEMIENDHPPEWLKHRRQDIRDRFGNIVSGQGA